MHTSRRQFPATSLGSVAPLSFLLFLGIALMSVTSVASKAAESLPQRVEKFLQPRLQTPAPGAADETAGAKILSRPDPETFFLRYAYGLQRHAKKLLTEEQAMRLTAVIERHKTTHGRWHDERNTLRCKWSEVMWRYASASNADAPALLRELDDWMRLRMTWTQQEHLAQYRFARDVWNVLTPEQQAKLIAGEWKQYAKLDTGHARADATAKIITRAVGKPERVAEFEATSVAWSKERAALHAAAGETENNERRIVFAMDLNTELLAHRASVAATDAYAKLYLSEADAVRRLVRAGYAAPQARCAKAAADAWGEAPKRYADGAAELIHILRQP